MNPLSASELEAFLPYMRDVVRCEQSLRELSFMWRTIEASAKINCPVEAKTILPTMAATRAGFDKLEQELVRSLVQEKVASVLDETGTKAQYVIDIVVRNLYERTADLGFLATDRELCAFAAAAQGDAGKVRARLRAYRNKYTVYDEIMLLDTHGNVLVQIDEATPVEGSCDPLIAATIASDSYVETFRATDLRPGKRAALIYSRRVHDPDGGKVVGVLCLCFNFEEEMAGIFRSHRDPEARSNMLLLDSENRVIASADERWIPLGATVPTNREGGAQLLVYGGREYLVRTCAAKGYQGYMGPPGWQGQVMVPVDVAFRGVALDALNSIDTAMADGLRSHARSFSPPLFEIMSAADTIRRVVWNGQVMTAGQRGNLAKLKTILDQISETGRRSDDLFSTSIHDLYQTVLAGSMRDSEFVSHLLVDLWDRNLYERSDDCRWWALTTELRAALARPNRDAADEKRIDAILQYINGLYTVYTRLFVYDRDGCIIASSIHGGDPAHVVGTRLDAEIVERVRALRSEQAYYVTPFGPCEQYGGRSTYVYHAAIRHPERDETVVGGIGIVFDAEAEFRAMLDAALGGKSDTTAFFLDRTGRILSSTDPSRATGTVFVLASDLLGLPNGCSASRLVTHDGHYAVLGCTVSNGYREFKVSDGYRDDIIAVVIQKFGQVQACGAKSAATVELETDRTLADAREYATFFVGRDLFAVDARYVREALPAAVVSQVSMGGTTGRIGILPLSDESGGTQYCWVFDLGYLLRGTALPIDQNSSVVVVAKGAYTIGLMVSELHAVPEFPLDCISANPFQGGDGAMLVSEVIKANHGRLLIQAINVDRMLERLGLAAGEEGSEPLRLSSGRTRSNLHRCDANGMNAANADHDRLGVTAAQNTAMRVDQTEIRSVMGVSRLVG